MIDKIESAKTATNALSSDTNNEAGTVAIGATTASAAGAKTNANLAGAVALNYLELLFISINRFYILNKIPILPFKKEKKLQKIIPTYYLYL
ncbi:hypothetical protein AXH25_04990 (plasmid) [Borrelia miyamotoi]|nr:hypothetical protein AXH25_04990 [Borrelia miyamotoi]